MAEKESNLSTIVSHRLDKIMVCACTYRRPEGLSALLHSFRALKFTPAMDVCFCIVDNDTEPSAQSIVESAAGVLSAPIRYVREASPGIPSARNRALQEACAHDFIVFVDDDETVDPHWLVELHSAAMKTRASFVQGIVEMRVEDAEDLWWLETVTFRQMKLPDLSSRHESWTNNVMVSMEFIARTGCRFDDSLRFDGGSDTLFFQDIVRHGGTGVFAANALVHEIQPKSRLTFRWTIKRQFRYGTTRARTVTLRQSCPRAIFYCVWRSGAMGVWGLGCLATSIVRGRAGLADSFAYVARGAGVLLGGFGVRRREYAREQ